MKGDSSFGPEQLGKMEQEPRGHLSGSPCLSLPGAGGLSGLTSTNDRGHRRGSQAGGACALGAAVGKAWAQVSRQVSWRRHWGWPPGGAA